MQRLVIWIGQEWNPQLRGLRFFGAQTLPLRLAPPLQYQLHMFHFLISTYRSVDSRKEIAQMFQTAIIWLSLLSYYFNLVMKNVLEKIEITHTFELLLCPNKTHNCQIISFFLSITNIHLRLYK